MFWSVDDRKKLNIKLKEKEKLLLSVRTENLCDCKVIDFRKKINRETNMRRQLKPH